MFKPRLLPLAIIAMGGLFLVKSENIIRSWLRGEAVEAPSVALARAADIAPPLAIAPPADRSPGGFRRLGPGSDGLAPDAPNAISQAERALLEQLRTRRGELEVREQSIVSRELVLAAAERRLTQRIEELTQLQQRLESMERTRGEREEAGGCSDAARSGDFHRAGGTCALVDGHGADIGSAVGGEGHSRIG